MSDFYQTFSRPAAREPQRISENYTQSECYVQFIRQYSTLFAALFCTGTNYAPSCYKYKPRFDTTRIKEWRYCTFSTISIADPYIAISTWVSSRNGNLVACGPGPSAFVEFAKDFEIAEGSSIKRKVEMPKLGDNQHGVLHVEIEYLDSNLSVFRLKTESVLALAQMNDLTGLPMPFSIGSPLAATSSGDHQKKSLSDEGHAVRMIVETLKNASSPIVIHIAGSCRDVARAGILFPELFREKCAGIYLNAGTGSRQTASNAELEYNVRLDPIEIQCDANGMTTWSPAAASTERHILHVRDVKNYSQAMTTAMRSLLATLPQRGRYGQARKPEFHFTATIKSEKSLPNF